MVKRCEWAKSELDIAYHDNEWGKPLHDDKKLFEMLIFEGMQAGLSWSTILAKRENMRKAFDDFDVIKIAKYDDAKIAELLTDSGIIRNRLKLNALRTNAIAFIKVQKEFGSFDKYIWGFVDRKPIINKFKDMHDFPTHTETSDKMSIDLKKRGFKFIGTTICYAYMQSIGMVNDHMVGCDFK